MNKMLLKIKDKEKLEENEKKKNKNRIKIKFFNPCDKFRKIRLVTRRIGRFVKYFTCLV